MLLCCCDVGAGIKGHNIAAQHQSPVEQWWVPGAEHYTGHNIEFGIKFNPIDETN